MPKPRESRRIECRSASGKALLIDGRAHAEIPSEKFNNVDKEVSFSFVAVW